MNIDIALGSSAKYTLEIGDLGGTVVSNVSHTHTPKHITVLSLSNNINTILLEVSSDTVGGKDTVGINIQYSNGDIETRYVEFHVRTMYL